MTPRQTLSLVVAAFFLGLLVQGKGCSDVHLPWPVVAPILKPTAATYVYEKDTTAVPSGVLTAFNQLNRAGIVASVFEQDTVDGKGGTPEQYKVPLAAAKEAGLPALVVAAGPKVLKVLKDPKTEAQVLEAAK